MTEESLSRSAALLGASAMARLAAARVLVVGVGGVGSWCAEALLRSGVGHLVLMDDDLVAPSNLNRQCPATAAALGTPKVGAMRARLLAIDPVADIVARAARFDAAHSDPVSVLAGIDLVVDAIDSVADKAALILAADEARIPLVSSMGAALRLDPTRVRVTRFEKVTGDGLARALRQRFRKLGRFPKRRFACVWSDEPPRACATRGSVMPVTAAFGMAIAAEALRVLAALVDRTREESSLRKGRI